MTVRALHAAHSGFCLRNNNFGSFFNIRQVRLIIKIFDSEHNSEKKVRSIDDSQMRPKTESWWSWQRSETVLPM